MKMIKRISLFLIVNLLVLITLGVSTSLLGVNQYLTQNGLNIGSLLVYAMIFGFAGATISLFLSKPLAKWSMGVKTIESGSGNSDERWLYQLVERYSQKLNINMPEVGIYDSAEMNAFATGASKNSSLVAVSTGLLGSMKKDEIEAVICHELGHVANGDMVTMTLIQGVINTFVIFLSRVIGYVVDKIVLKNENSSGIGYTITVLILDIVLGIAASIVVATFSRYREYHADAASARLMGGPGSMIKALEVLGAGAARGELPQNIRAFGINGSGEGWLSLFSTHPSIEKRIAALRSGAYNKHVS